MKKLKLKITSRLKGRSGESIAEVLIALLIAALAMTMLVTAISSTTKIITQSKAKMTSYYDENSGLSSHTGGTSGSVNFKVDGDVKFLTTGNDVAVAYETNDEVANKPVIAYWISFPAPTTSPSPSEEGE